MIENTKLRDFQTWLAIATAITAVFGFLWGIFVWQGTKRSEVLAIENSSLLRSKAEQLNASRPFLELQLSAYKEIVRQSSMGLEISPKQEELELWSNIFWGSYYGHFSLVASPSVQRKARLFGEALDRGEKKEELSKLSLALSEACRSSLDKSWGINAWSNPDLASNKPLENLGKSRP